MYGTPYKLVYRFTTIYGAIYGLYCIVLYLQPVLNPKSYDGARVLEASGRPLLVKGRSYWVVRDGWIKSYEFIQFERPRVQKYFIFGGAGAGFLILYVKLFYRSINSYSVEKLHERQAVWVKGHKGIKGNEEADKLCREASILGTSLRGWSLQQVSGRGESVRQTGVAS